MLDFSFNSFFVLIILPVGLLLLISAIFLVAFTLAFIATCYIKGRKQRRNRKEDDPITIGFFHPYCNAGGGGERVLWVAVNTILNRYSACKIYIYTGDVDATPKEILNKAQTRFNVKVDLKKVNFIYLNLRKFIEADRYPYFTLLLQSFGSIILGFEAFWKFIPDIFIDTTGHAFTMPIFKYLGRCKISTYTHYPTITEDMIKRVKHRMTTYNNKSIISRNPMFTWVKIIYYQMFAWLYGKAGRSADIAMVNGSWTEDHINKLWKIPFKTFRVYPPCEVEDLKLLTHIPPENGHINIISVGQFRPEKDHPLMLQALYELRTLLRYNENLWNRIQLIFVGSIRNDEDKERVSNLNDLSKHLSLENHVKFRVNVSYAELIDIYKLSSIGLHAMYNEHFGISVVECMAAGLVMIAHRSGGPLADIIETSEGSQTGFLAVSPQDYAHAILEAIALTSDQANVIRGRARASVDRFSQKSFERTFINAIQPLFEALKH